MLGTMASMFSLIFRQALLLSFATTGKRYAYLKGVNAHSEMALYVDTFEEVDLQYQHAIENGASALMEPTTEPWGQRTCFIADPEGNIIEIGSWNKPYEEKDQ